jgi:hypothetical protein
MSTRLSAWIVVLSAPITTVLSSLFDGSATPPLHSILSKAMERALVLADLYSGARMMGPAFLRGSVSARDVRVCRIARHKLRFLAKCPNPMSCLPPALAFVKYE